MSSKLYIGNGQATPSIVVEKQVPVTMPYSILKSIDSNGKAINDSYLMDFSAFTDIDPYVFAYTYYQNTNITGTIDLSSLKKISGQYGCAYMFRGCTGLTSVDLSALTTISNYGCYYMFDGCTGLTGLIDLSSLTTVTNNYSCYNMFSNCTGITGVNLSALTTIGSTSSFLLSNSNYQCCNMFYGCTGITGALNLSSLTTIKGTYSCATMFGQCSNITSVDLSGLTSITKTSSSIIANREQYTCNSMFIGCTSLKNIDLSSLSKIDVKQACNYMFQNCTSLTTLSFPALKSNSFGSYTDQFDDMLAYDTGVTVHFPSNLQSVIGSWTSVQNGFGGTNTTVLFDLPATE